MKHFYILLVFLFAHIAQAVVNETVMTGTNNQTIQGVKNFTGTLQTNGTSVVSQISAAQAFAIQRANHTGTQLANTISNLAATVATLPSATSGSSTLSGSAILSGSAKNAGTGGILRYADGTVLTDGADNALNDPTGHALTNGESIFYPGVSGAELANALGVNSPDGNTSIQNDGFHNSGFTISLSQSGTLGSAAFTSSTNYATAAQVLSSPASIPGLKLWVSAGDLVLSNSATVTSWVDRSGNGNTLTPSQYGVQTFQLSGINGHPAVLFTGSNFGGGYGAHANFMQTGTNFFSSGWSNAMSVYVVAKRSRVAGSTDMTVLWSASSTSSVAQGNLLLFKFGADQNGKIGYPDSRIAANVTVNDAANGIFCMRPNIYGLVTDGTNQDMRVNGKIIRRSASTSGTLGLSNAFCLGDGRTYGDGAFAFSGAVAEVLVFNRALSAAESLVVESYLAETYLMKERQIVWSGHSQMYAPYAGIDNALGYQVERLLPAGWHSECLGVGSQGVEAYFQPNDKYRLDNGLRSRLGDIAILWGSENDTNTPANIYASMSQWCADRRAAGYKPILVTRIPTNVVTESNRFALNALIRSGTAADAVVDLDTVPQVGGSNANITGSNSYYYSDTVHLLPAGYQLITTLFANTIKSVQSGTGSAVVLGTGTLTVVGSGTAAQVGDTIPASVLSGTVTSANGGTGVSNTGTLTNASNTTITGGGTIALGGFTMTAPATGTVALLGATNSFTQPITITKANALGALGIFSGNGSSYVSLQIGRTSADLELAIPGANGQFANDAVQGDTILKTTSRNIILNTSGGTNPSGLIVGAGSSGNVTVGNGSLVIATAAKGIQFKNGETLTSGTGLGVTQSGNLAISGSTTLGSAGSTIKTLVSGTGILVSGTSVVSDANIGTTSRIIIGDNAGGVLANMGAVYEDSAVRVSGTMTIKSVNVLDTSKFSYLIINP